MSSDVLLRSDADGVRTLTLNRPDALNALSVELFEALDREIKTLSAAGDDVRCVIIRGAGRSFCAGADLREVKERLAAGRQSAEHVYYKADIIRALEALPLPVIAAVQGHCYTGGLELALASDIIYAASNVRFADTHAKIGGRAAWGLPQRLSRRVGLSAAKEIMFSARPLNADDALRIGLVNRIVAPEELDTEAMKLAQEIAANAASVVTWLKAVVNDGAGLPLDEALAWERTQRGASRDVSARLKDTKW